MMTADAIPRIAERRTRDLFRRRADFRSARPSDTRADRRVGCQRLRPLLRSEAGRGRRLHEDSRFRGGTARAGRVARVRRSADARHVRIDHDAAHRGRSHRADVAGERGAHPRIREGRAGARRAHHAVHHRRERRPQPAARPAGRSRRLRARREAHGRRHRHSRRQAAHLGGVDGPRVDDDPHEIDEGATKRTTRSRAWFR